MKYFVLAYTSIGALMGLFLYLVDKNHHWPALDQVLNSFIVVLIVILYILITNRRKKARQEREVIKDNDI